MSDQKKVPLTDEQEKIWESIPKATATYGRSDLLSALKKLDELREQNRIMREALEDISKQKPEKPDHWSSCHQCESNINDADDALTKVKEIT